MTPYRLVLLATATILTIHVSSQDSDSATQRLHPKYLDKISAESSHISNKIDKKSDKALRQMQKLETRLKQKLTSSDSLKASSIFGDIPKQYNQFQERLQSIVSSPQHLTSPDTITASIKFLQQNPQLLQATKNATAKLTKASANVKGLEDQFQKAEEVKAFLKERKQYLKAQLNKLGYARQLKRLNKQAFYYGQQIAEYKNIIAEPKRAEQKAFEYLRKTKLFTDFMNKNSRLAGLFPGNAVDQNSQGAVAGTGFAGLQTREQVTSFMQQTVFKTPNSLPQVQKNLQSAQSQVDQLRNKLSSLGIPGGNDLDMPDFKPNNQRTRSFRKRLEYGINFQSQKTNRFFPVTSDIGFSVGYKITDKNVIGIGGSYKIGWGSGWKNIKLTNQGAGIRSFIDWHIKGSFWISGGYERNYRQFPEVEGTPTTPPLGGWAAQQSGLLGISKTVSMKSKLFKKTKFQLLWDFLSYRQVPRTNPIIFRIGYSL